ncbi:MAG TPA: sialidase family protein [Thermomonas sp.]|jgi:hypothetical protein|uniref:sialidase family protein n=1 Tax=Thermomonas sp. TaxID=1971895 RepID=UPI002BA8F44C|nr:sialidase family protein [Thermomonas sp.]HOV97100.1 sialidase family protein [Thermomonas sp.]
MNMRIAVASLIVITTLVACKRDTPATPPAPASFAVQTWVLPSEPGSMAPDLVTAPGGRVLLSWINRSQGRRNALQFAAYTEAAGWQSQPRTIAVGNSLLANAADTPHLLATADGALWSQWLQTQPDNPSGYDTVLARSKDGGMSWTQITRVNNDGQAAEHGFAALWPHGTNGLGMAWLDGRAQAAQPIPAHDHAQHAMGAMQLRSNIFNLDLQRGEDAVVDARSCDCCQTAAAMTEQGPLLAWRDRSDADIRDIAVARFENGAWTPPKLVHADGWKIEACPVAGPALAAQGKTAVVLWYSEAGGTPTLRMARSVDAGSTFAEPVVLDTGTAVLGRAAIGVDAQHVWALWLREDAHGQTLLLARYTPDLSKRLQQVTVATLGARGMASGYPKLAVDAGGAWLAWTDVIGGVAHLKGARVAR